MPKVENTSAAPAESSLQASPTTAATEDVRIKLVESALKDWKGRLIDLSRRNPLLYFRPTRAYLHPVVSPTLLGSLQAGSSLTLGDFFPDGALVEDDYKLMRRKARENSEERGLSTLYLASGLVSWKSRDEGRPPECVLLLYPITLSDRGLDPLKASVALAGRPQVNPVLLHVLRTEFGYEIDPTLLEGLETDAEDVAKRLISALAENLPQLSHSPFVTIGNFAFAKLSIVRDLEEQATAVVENDVVAAIAGDGEARASLAEDQVEIEPAEVDTVHPDDDYSVVESDSSQQAAVMAALEGQHLCIVGPPGTGKSQTITNLIANIIANKKTVLFVAEKRAALEVVKERLTETGLAHMAIDLAGADQRPRAVMQSLAETLRVIESVPEVRFEADHARFVDRRTKLNIKDELTHQLRVPTGMSVYEMQGALLQLPSEVVSPIRLVGDTLKSLDAKRYQEISDLIHDYSELRAELDRPAAAPWMRVPPAPASLLQDLAARIQTFKAVRIPALRMAVAEAQTTIGLRVPVRISELTQIHTVVTAITDALTAWKPESLRQGRLRAAVALVEEREQQGVLQSLLRHVMRGDDPLRVELDGLSLPGLEPKPTSAQLRGLSELGDAWRLLSSFPVPPSGDLSLQTLLVAIDSYVEDWRFIALHFNAPWWTDLPLKEITQKIDELTSDPGVSKRIERVRSIEAELNSAGLAPLLEDLTLRKVPRSEWLSHLRYVWLASTLDDVARNEPDVLGFVGSSHNRYVEEFRHVDAMRLKIARSRVRRLHAENCVAAKNQYPGQIALIKQEAARSRRHKPLRAMFRDAGEMLLALAPCWMSSPLNVSQLLECKELFDYVIFDEASQLLPEDAIASILRGRHLIVAGDNKQLPPTTFFASADNAESTDDEDQNEADGYESLLDMMLPFVPNYLLEWHYRSKHESLIAFSNRKMYDNRLITFPSPLGDVAVRHHLVDELPAPGAPPNQPEIRRVVNLVLNHAKRFPAKSLGVITMGQKHAFALQAALDVALERRPDLAPFFDLTKRERFFVKSIELVQGDERDCILVSVGYAKDANGKLPLRFGPILSASGSRRLNVAVTRARERLAIVSSFSYADIEASKVKAGSGVEFLREFLMYAAEHGRSAPAREAPTPMNDFERDIYAALTAKGLQLAPQVGASAYRLDFAVIHPSDPARYVLALECDGANYHASHTARDRDRLRQQHLEGLGWSFCRIWSTDWFLRKDEEIQRVLEAVAQAVVRSDEQKQRFLEELATIAPEAPRANVIPMPAASSADRPPLLPPLPVHESIEHYRSADLRRLYQWISEDGKLRSEDEAVEEMFKHLPFKKRGKRIEEALRQIVRRG